MGNELVGLCSVPGACILIPTGLHVGSQRGKDCTTMDTGPFLATGTLFKAQMSGREGHEGFPKYLICALNFQGFQSGTFHQQYSLIPNQQIPSTM